MGTLVHWLTAPWPWYVAGPVIGLMVPLMLVIGSRSFGISSNFRHLCAMNPAETMKPEFFRYDWRASTWSLVYGTGVVLGGFLASVVFANPAPPALSEAALAMFAAWGMATPTGLLPPELFSLTPGNIAFMLGAGAVVGFGTRYAAGCTSGHAITGLATLQVESLVAVLGIFSGGLLSSHFLLGWFL